MHGSHARATKHVGGGSVERREREQQLMQKAIARLDELGRCDDLPDRISHKQATVRAAIERARARRQAEMKR